MAIVESAKETTISTTTRTKIGLHSNRVRRDEKWIGELWVSGTLGSTSNKFEASLEQDPDPANDAHWQDIDATLSGGTLTEGVYAIEISQDATIAFTAVGGSPNVSVKAR